jgi:hypothetical protein
MKKHIYIKPRRTGKTGRAIELVSHSKGNALFVSYIKTRVEHIKKKSKTDDFDNVEFVSSGELKHFFMGNNKKYDLVVLDEFLYFDKLSEVYAVLNNYSDSIEKLVMFSTPYRSIDAEAFEFIKENKHLGFKTLERFVCTKYRLSHEEFYHWFYNFMTDSDANLIMDTSTIYGTRTI